MWLVIRGAKGGWQSHSVHKEKTEAEAWMRCILHEGKYDASLCELDEDSIDAIIQASSAGR